MRPRALLMSPSNACQYQSRNQDVSSRLDVTARETVSLRLSISAKNSRHWLNTLSLYRRCDLAYALLTRLASRRYSLHQSFHSWKCTRLAFSLYTAMRIWCWCRARRMATRARSMCDSHLRHAWPSCPLVQDLTARRIAAARCRLSATCDSQIFHQCLVRRTSIFLAAFFAVAVLRASTKDCDRHARMILLPNTFAKCADPLRSIQRMRLHSFVASSHLFRDLAMTEFLMRETTLVARRR